MFKLSQCSIIILFISVIVIAGAIILFTRKEKFTACLGDSCGPSAYPIGTKPPNFTNSVASGASSFGVDNPSILLSTDSSGNISTSSNLPIGSIVMWSDPMSVPSGWHLCDGSTVVMPDGSQVVLPDMRGRFPVGAGAGSSSLSQYDAGDMGGEETHTLSVAEMPAHGHALYDAVGWGDGNAGYNGGSNKISGQASIGGAGGSQAHNNLPPFYGIAFIIKIAY